MSRLTITTKMNDDDDNNDNNNKNKQKTKGRNEEKKCIYVFSLANILVMYSYLKFLLLSTYVKKYRIIDSIVNRF